MPEQNVILCFPGPSLNCIDWSPLANAGWPIYAVSSAIMSVPQASRWYMIDHLINNNLPNHHAVQNSRVEKITPAKKAFRYEGMDIPNLTYVKDDARHRKISGTFAMSSVAIEGVSCAALIGLDIFGGYAWNDEPAEKRIKSDAHAMMRCEYIQWCYEVFLKDKPTRFVNLNPDSPISAFIETMTPAELLRRASLESVQATPPAQ